MKNTKKETSSKQKDADRKARASAKADRLNPDKLKTVPDLQAEKLEQQESEKKNKKDEEAPAANGVNQEQLNMSKMDIDMDGEKETEADVVPMAVPGSIGELRQKLQARIQNLRQKRKAPEDDVSREALLEKRMKRRKSTKEAKAKAKKAGSAGREQ
ncbi:hypothetical protein IWW55_005724, partial [Coemansia sp. RSA 2706]